MTAGASADQRLRVAVDIGGTFVDAIELDTQRNLVRLQKAAATPARPWEGVLAAIDKLGVPLDSVDRFIHGTTIGLNALLERRGGVTGIITNRGFRDIFLIGRGNVPDAEMFNFRWRKPPSLVRRRHTVGVAGRINARGEIVEELDEADVRAAARYLVEQGVESIAICFLHSYRNPVHEQRAAAVIRSADDSIEVAVSSDIHREYREYERTSTTVIDAYIRPVFGGYVDRLRAELASAGFVGSFLIMRSGGGAMTTEHAKRAPTQTLLSGPAGGIVGAGRVANALGRRELLTFDVGGTSLDTCVIEEGTPVTRFEAEIERYPLLIPIYDIRTIGAGGGSIATIEGGLLKVGPRSAGAEPGPVCYGRGGTEPTVTDAAVCLGYVDPDRFLAGAMRLDEAGARAAVQERLGDPMGLDTGAAAARVFDVLLARTIGAVRQITVERGRDPRTFSMLAFGGAGPLLGPLLAREMGVREVIVPQAPAGFSAWGMLAAELVDDFARTDLRILGELSAEELALVFGEIEHEAVASLRQQGAGDGPPMLELQLDLRYLGQEHALTVTVNGSLDPAEIREVFEHQHNARYGHVMGNAVQVLTMRVRAIGSASTLEIPFVPGRGAGKVEDALLGRREAWCFASGAMAMFDVFERSELRSGDRLKGPAIVDEGTSTTVLFSDQRVEVDRHGHLLVTASDDPS